ncbi:MAG: exodeoxyribonuclease V subunit beta [Proteobacteria bacterium]|nr:exodeoxyribonuclease V subunit beta [Pseudomonadota bacterium]
MKTFNLLNTPLSGTNLIEASAGTGKTYTIAGLFLRLILEERLLADQILVVTFTKAATAELKERIRNTILQAKSAFSKGSSADTIIDTLVKTHDDPKLAVSLLQRALIDFDKAAIFTIHGFCQRILQENTFETRSLFDTELVSDPSNLCREIADDFWRKHFYDMPAELLGYALKKISGPEYFTKLLAKKQTPETRIIPDLEPPELNRLGDFKKIFNKLKNAWPTSKATVSQRLKSPALSGTVYGSLKTSTKQAGLSRRDLKVVAMVDAMDRFVHPKHAFFPLFDGFEKFTTGKLIAFTRKNHTAPLHELFDICDELFQISTDLESEMEKYLMYLKIEFFKFTAAELGARKQNANIQFFDDLLLMVKKALADQAGNALAHAVRQKYKAALVDEFQDTDSIQYEIFSRLFSSKPCPLFFIGDPKQAIYSFRGADIFSYMKAVHHADLKFTLIENWRSDPDLITAINTIFSNINAPFVFGEIPFEAGVPGKTVITASGKKPFTLWYLSPESEGVVSKTEAIPIIAAAVADEISRLIFPGSTRNSGTENKYVKAGDIAVLVRTNRQAQIIKKHLSARRIPSVLFSAGNIFHTQEALEMERILSSISEPADERRFRAALVTDITGVPGYELDLEAVIPAWWEDRFRSFRHYFQQWQQHGFIRMFNRFMSKEIVRKRLLSLPDGERRLTNVLHLAEILHQESIENKPGITGLVRWLSVQRKTALSGSEVHQLRLESDEYAVKIVTIHKSKGLEYPVVFCPYAWDGSIIEDREVTFHTEDKDQALMLDLDAKNNRPHLQRAQNELLAENIRLLYVALTRAKKRCYLVWGRFRTAETAAMAYLFHSGRMEKNNLNGKDLVTALKSSVSTLENEDLSADLRLIESRSKGTINLAALPIGNHSAYRPFKRPAETLCDRQFSGNIDISWKIASYSYMVSKRFYLETLPDHDAYTDIKQNISEYRWDITDRTDIFSFPTGTRTGIFVHDIFEHLDFALKDTDHLTQLVGLKLKAYGFDAKWEETICSMIQNVLRTPLMPDDAALTLSSIQCEDRINEMEFYFPLKPVAPQQIKTVFNKSRNVAHLTDFSDRIGNLTFSTAKGFMKGYIDMLFQYKGRYFLVDWKSNLLGSHLADYDKSSLYQAMNHNLYMLQYHLYSLALHQYLKTRVPGYRYETDFGGVFYIFVRGMDPKRGPNFGVYHDLPAPDIIFNLGKTLIPGF